METVDKKSVDEFDTEQEYYDYLNNIADKEEIEFNKKDAETGEYLKKYYLNAIEKKYQELKNKYSNDHFIEIFKIKNNIKNDILLSQKEFEMLFNFLKKGVYQNKSFKLKHEPYNLK